MIESLLAAGCSCIKLRELNWKYTKKKHVNYFKLATKKPSNDFFPCKSKVSNSIVSKTAVISDTDLSCLILKQGKVNEKTEIGYYTPNKTNSKAYTTRI